MEAGAVPYGVSYVTPHVETGMSASDRLPLRVRGWARVLRIAALLSSAWPADVEPDPTFVADLERRLRKQIQPHA